MKTIKYLLTAFLLFVCVFLPCELYQYYFDICNSFVETDFFRQDHDTTKMLSDIDNEAKAENIYIFKMIYTTNSAFSSTIDIYADNSVRQILEDRYFLRSGMHKSIFSGETTVVYHNFFSISDVIQKENTKFQMIGDLQSVKKFKSKLINQYGGGFPQSSGMDSLKDIKWTIYIAWFFLIAFNCFLTYSDVLSIKKESFIRIVMGESINKIYVKYVLTDIVVYTLLYTIYRLIAIQIYGTLFLSAQIGILFSIYCLLNMVLPLKLLNIHPSMENSINSYPKHLLAVNYFLKAVVIVSCCVTLSAFATEIQNCINYYSQKSVYETYSSYCVLSNFIAKNEDPQSIPEIQSKFYEEFSDSLDIIYDYQCTVIDSNSELAIQMNHNSIPLLKSQIKELSDYSFLPKTYVILNESTNLMESDLISLAGDTSFQNVEILTYSKNSYVFTMPLEIDDYVVSKKVKNPVVILHNTTNADDAFKDEIMLDRCFLHPNDKMQQFLNDRGVEFSSTNMMELFKYHWLKLKRTLYLSVIASFIFFLLQCFILVSLIRLEYSVNSVEISLKKIMGYSLSQRFKKHLMFSFILYGSCILLCFAIGTFSKFDNTLLMLLVIIMLFMIDYVFFSYTVKRNDRKNLIRVFKGDIL